MQPHPNSQKVQIRRVFDRLSKGPANTLELHRELGILNPAASVHALRQMGHQIKTQFVHVATDDGICHPHVAMYTLTEAHHEQ